MMGPETLLERTRRRAALAIAPARTLVALTRRHRRFYEPLLRGTPTHCALVQPEDRGTTPAILYGLRRIAPLAPTASVAIMPSDHYVSDDAIFMRHVTAAFDAAQARPELVVLLGIEPEGPETEYGWIEPAAAIPGTRLLGVSRFWEKPEPAVAVALFARRCLWNSFVIVATVSALLDLIRRGAASTDAAFATALPTLGTGNESAAMREVYQRLPASSFSADVLASRPASLAAFPVSGVRWSDWGHPDRVLSTLAGLGVRPEWMDQMASSCLARFA